MAVRTHQIRVPHPRQGRPGSSRWFALAVLCVSILMVNLDNTVLNVALPTLVRDLQATSSQLGVAGRVGGATGHLLAHVARSAFISGADLGPLIAAAVVLAGCVLALVTLPARPRADAEDSARPS